MPSDNPTGMSEYTARRYRKMVQDIEVYNYMNQDQDQDQNYDYVHTQDDTHPQHYSLTAMLQQFVRHILR